MSIDVVDEVQADVGQGEAQAILKTLAELRLIVEHGDSGTFWSDRTQGFRYAVANVLSAVERQPMDLEFLQTMLGEFTCLIANDAIRALQDTCGNNDRVLMVNADEVPLRIALGIYELLTAPDLGETD